MRERLRLHAGQRRERRRAHRIDVGRRQRASLELLRSHVADGADDGARASPAHELAHGAEVDEHVGPVRASHDVAWLDVAMDHRRATPVEIGQRAIGAGEEATNLVLGERTDPPPHRVERLALDLLHDEVERAVLLEVREVAGHERVIERREHARLALRELDVLPGPSTAHVEALDRDGASGLDVHRVVGHALRALTEHAANFVATVAEVGLAVHGGPRSTPMRGEHTAPLAAPPPSPRRLQGFFLIRPPVGCTRGSCAPR